MSDRAHSATAARAKEPNAYALFEVELARAETLSPHMARMTFVGPDVARMRTCAADQRIKVFFPRTPGGPVDIEDAADWYAHYKARDAAERPPMRTYTIRELRPDALVLDFVLHGDGGPASRWALAARPGDRLKMMVPDAAFPGDPGGYEWRPPAELADVLLIADETALPALAGILESLASRPHPPRTQAFVEIPGAADALPAATWQGLELTWLPRDGAEHGVRMIEALASARTPSAAATVEATPASDVDIDTELPWERAATGAPGAGFYAWVAGESGAVMQVRRELVQVRGLDRRAINLMGYWRLGRVIE